MDHSSNQDHDIRPIFIDDIPTFRHHAISASTSIDDEDKPIHDIDEIEAEPEPSKSPKPQYGTLIVALVLSSLLGVALYFAWTAPLPSSTHQVVVTPSVKATMPARSEEPDPPKTTAKIEAYIIGAVQHPGIYSLDAGSRVYHLLKAAGGPLPDANLVALNLAAKLKDGQEVYVTKLGEVPPTYVGGVPGIKDDTQSDSNTEQVNINQATVDELREILHVSSKTAQAIVDYRTRNGPYTAVEDLLQVISQSIYDRIKKQVTV
ncbi:comEA protein [Thermosporothrix hazakensis]|jgi:competence protein ComEA|uniref:ComEA protein n=2 Tax=Thermosporothrix TaxID=768650 RepID=A0A326UA87_THEHA|nr:ComEA family DNA-binding protein [Thermosporothrix hazakensis]PZW32970.1 comEA protein [Thermosporothrix hazakensis]BBH90952.1 hypothetical protein KTC_57030 [Thermosporothrix sp. COM3]GCE49002.1 hypothetical protein KTH_38710 [Thermosporothrix hazakensis]